MALSLSPMEGNTYDYHSLSTTMFVAMALITFEHARDDCTVLYASQQRPVTAARGLEISS